jgi:hypothetical protein
MLIWILSLRFCVTSRIQYQKLKSWHLRGCSTKTESYLVSNTRLRTLQYIWHYYDIVKEKTLNTDEIVCDNGYSSVLIKEKDGI